MAFAFGRSYAPGVTVYEDAIPAYSNPASFNTTYMLVVAPEDTSVTVFPFNRPISVTSLNEYDNLIGTLPLTGPELTSYYSVKAFFQQVTNGDLRVTRVGTPGVIQELSFDPAGLKDDSANPPSKLLKGDTVYAKILINGVELGDHTPNGGWLGVPVLIPETYSQGDTDNNLAISSAIRDAVGFAIEANADVRVGTYVREAGTGGEDSCSECAWLHVTGRLFNTQVEIVPVSTITSNEYTFTSNTFSVQNVSARDSSVYDWIQCARTAFEDPNLPQGYMISPTAFSIFNQADRVNLGQTMEEVCSDSNHKWMALVDCGPYEVTSITEYRDMKEHSPADCVYPAQLVLVNNTIYTWVNGERQCWDEAAFDEYSEYNCTNPDLLHRERRALKDNRQLTVTVGDPASPAVNLVDETLRLDTAWPSNLRTGERLVISPPIIINIEDRATIPTYSDSWTDAINIDLQGVFYVIAADFDTSLDEYHIRLATSRTRALGGLGIDFNTPGSPGAGGALLNLQYTEAAWEFEVDIKGKTSNLIECNQAEGASFNTVHLPATLQKHTREDDFKAVARQLTDPSQALIKGGRTLKYFGSASWRLSDSTLLLDDHGLTTGSEFNLHIFPDANGAILEDLPVDKDYVFYAIRVSENRIQLALSLEDAEAGINLVVSSTGSDSQGIRSPLGAFVQGALTTGGDILILSADHGLNSGEAVMFNDSISTAERQIYRDTSAERTFSYLVARIDRNFFATSESSSNLAVSNYVNWPGNPIVTTTPVIWYQKVDTAINGGNFENTSVVRWMRGRKYKLDCTLGVYALEDETGRAINTNNTNPYTGAPYTQDLSTDFRFSASYAPVPVNEFTFAAADATTTGITVAGHGYELGQEIVFNAAFGATLPAHIEEGRPYYVSGIAGLIDDNVIAVAENLVDAVAGVLVVINPTTAVDGPSGICGGITLSSNPYTFQYTEDERAYPLSHVRDFVGENNFYCVPLSDGSQANQELTQIYGHPCIDTDNEQKPLYGAAIKIEFVQGSANTPNSLWNFDAVTAQDVVDEALRGVRNDGVAAAAVVEKGMDSHSRLFEESQKYYTTQGFLAYYAPYIKNDVDVWVPPTGYVAGFAMKRYREEIAGFRLPPAGVKYTLAGARGVSVEISQSMQHVSNPYGMNALRQLPGYSSIDPDTGETYGPVFIWGARTRINPADAKQSMYKFVNTRIIMNVIYGTISRGLDSQIFSIIDGRAVTFNQIRTIVSNTLYQSFYVPGALFGSTAADAFDVIVDDRNNPPGALEDGLVNVQVFVVPVPTLERIEIDLLRVSIGGIKQSQEDLGYLPWTPNRI